MFIACVTNIRTNRLIDGLGQVFHVALALKSTYFIEFVMWKGSSSIQHGKKEDTVANTTVSYQVINFEEL